MSGNSKNPSDFPIENHQKLIAKCPTGRPGTAGIFFASALGILSQLQMGGA